MNFDYDHVMKLLDDRRGNVKGYGLYINSLKARLRGGWKRKMKRKR